MVWWGVGVGGCRLDALSAIKVIIRQNEETLLCRGRNSHSDISRPRTWKRLSVKYVIAFPT